MPRSTAVVRGLAGGCQLSLDLATGPRRFPDPRRGDPRPPAGLSRLRRFGAEAGGRCSTAWTMPTGTNTPMCTAACTRSPIAPPKPTRAAAKAVARFLNAVAARGNHLHPLGHRSDQPRCLVLCRAADRGGRRDRPHDHGAPLQYRAVAFSPRAQGRGAQMGRRARRWQLRPRRLRGGARPEDQDGRRHPHVERSGHGDADQADHRDRPCARHPGADRRQPGRRARARSTCRISAPISTS